MVELSSGFNEWMKNQGNQDHGEKLENPFDALIATMDDFNLSDQFNF